MDDSIHSIYTLLGVYGVLSHPYTRRAYLISRASVVQTGYITPTRDTLLVAAPLVVFPTRGCNVTYIYSLQKLL